MRIVKYIFCVVTLLLAPLGTMGRNCDVEFNQEESRRPTVALVLCGGGAKGMAHIGVIKRLEEIGIKPDMVLGTSIGSLVGGMYAMGYTGLQLDSIVRGADWDYLLSDEIQRSDINFAAKAQKEQYLLNIPFRSLRDSSGNRIQDATLLSSMPAGFVTGNNVLNYLTGLAIGYQDSIDFNTLPIPFACIATDLSTGEPVVLNKGSLPLAMRASMAIPGFFEPVTIDGVVLVDGGVVNNFPVDVARRMGADIVIGVDIQSDLAGPSELKSLDAVLLQLVGLLGNDKYLANKGITDIYIKPDVSGFSTMSFNSKAVDILLDNGYRAAVECDSVLFALKERLGDYGTGERAPAAREISGSSFYVESIECDGVASSDATWLLKKAGLEEGSLIEGTQINRALSLFYGTQAFSLVTYTIDPTDDGAASLKFHFTRGPVNVLSVGARYDTEEAAAVLFHVGIHQYDLRGSKAFTTMRLSYNPYVKLGYSYVFRNFPQIDFQYEIARRDFNIYSSKSAKNNIQYIYNGAELALSGIKYFKAADMKLGARIENFNYLSFLTGVPELQDVTLKARGYISLFLQDRIDTRDETTFFTKGVAMDAEASYYLKGFHSEFSDLFALRLNFETALDFGGGFVALPQVYMRLTFNNETEAPLYNYVGGLEPGRYIAHQIPFIGISYASSFDRDVAVLRLDLRQKLGKKHYIYLMGNYMRAGHNMEDMVSFAQKGIWGVGAQYSYDTKLGPISLNVNWSDYNKKKVGLYLSAGYFF